MKKLIFLLFIFCSVLGFSQTLKTNELRVDSIIYSRAFTTKDTLIAKGDTAHQFKIMNVADPVNPLDAVNFRTFQTGGGALPDSVPYINFYKSSNPPSYRDGRLFYDTLTHTPTFYNNRTGRALTMLVPDNALLFIWYVWPDGMFKPVAVLVTSLNSKADSPELTPVSLFAFPA